MVETAVETTVEGGRVRVETAPVTVEYTVSGAAGVNVVVTTDVET